MGYIRTPLATSWRRSPFEGLMEHAHLVRECMVPLREAVEAYKAGDMERYETAARGVMEKEHEADIIKSRVRNNLPKAVFMPVDKSTFLMLLREEDAILDYAEDVVVWLGMRKTVIPDDLKKSVMEFFGEVEATVKAYEEGMAHISDLVKSSFSKKEGERVKEHIKDVHEREYRADKLNHALSKEIFSREEELGPVGVYHLLKAVNLMDQIANHAENAVDRLRAMISR